VVGMIVPVCWCFGRADRCGDKQARFAHHAVHPLAADADAFDAPQVAVHLLGADGVEQVAAAQRLFDEREQLVIVHRHLGARFLTLANRLAALLSYVPGIFVERRSWHLA